MKKLVVVGGLIFLIGCLMFSVTMSALKWDFTKLSNRPPFEEKTMVVENNNQTITVESHNAAILVVPSSDDKIHFIYGEREKEYYEFDQSNDIKIKKIYDYEWYEYISIMDFHSEEPFTILLPDNFTGKLNFTTSNAKIQVKDVSIQNIAATTGNGKVEFNNVNVLDDLIVKTSNNAIDFNGIQVNGKIDLTTNDGSVNLNDISAKTITAKSSNNKILAKNLEASDEIQLETSNGRIEFESISANDSIILATNNNHIKGILSGKMSDYNITSKTSNGKNNLPERMPDGHTELHVSTNNGNIDVLFDGK